MTNGRRSVRERLSASVRKHSRLVRLSVQLAIAAVLVSAVVTVGFVEYSARPSFCLNCHIMEPYYESWETSSHNEVPCIKCHYAPGIRAEAMGKLQAANQVVKYVTGTYGLKPWAEIEDAACLRSGCHVEGRLEADVDYNGVRFNHAQHLGELRRGKQLRCTSCHSQIVQGAHVAVTAATCFLCHFKGRLAQQPIAGCVGCHPMPSRIETAEYVVDHPQYVEDLVSCLSCHDQVTQGTGGAEQARCFNCHNEPERVGEFANTTLVHQVHIAERNVECTQCHTPIDHRVISRERSQMALNCASCHRDVHEAQRRLLAGSGGHGVPENPAPMYLASVSCVSCHEQVREIVGHEEVNVAREASCLSCHGISYANILPSWQSEMERRLSEVEAVLALVRRARRSAPDGASGPAVDSLIGLADENIELVRVGRGPHNIAYADQLLRAANDFLREAARVGQLGVQLPRADLGPAVAGTRCLQCHLGTERRVATFQGSRFPHERHVAQIGLACSACHTPYEQHGGITIDRDDCAQCHHQAAEPGTCGACHEGANGVPADVQELPQGDFPHEPHTTLGLACQVCHQPPGMAAAQLNCSNCHAPHHQPDVTCINCHRSGAKEKHALSFAHRNCSECHGEKVQSVNQWTRKVCTVCHVDQVDHNAPVQCHLCHEMDPLTPPTDQ